MSDYLFAYGTLRSGHAPAEIAPVVEKLRPVGAGYVYGVLYDLGTCPGLVLDPSSRNKISGLVYQLPDDPDVLRRLDEYEEFHPDAPEKSAFLRTLHPVEIAPERSLECWIYVYNQSAGCGRTAARIP